MSWDLGLRWHLEQTADQAPDLDTYDPLPMPFVRDQHLRSPNGSVEDEYIQHLIRVSYREAERVTRRPLVPQGRTMVLDRFPCGTGAIELGPNLLSVESIDYIDTEGADQQLAGSPEMFQTSAPSGEKPANGYITPLYGETWPSTRFQAGAVRVTFQQGYPIVDGAVRIPEDITHARLLIIGELYKQRSLSVHAFNQNPAIIQARSYFVRYRAHRGY